MPGVTFQFSFTLIFLLGVGHVNKYWFDIKVKKFTEFPDQSALDSAKHFNAMQTPAILAFDATWSHTRNTKLCVNDFIN